MEQNGFMASVVETIKTIFWALIIAGVFRTLFFQPFWIPSSSMKDTLLIGDFLFVNKMAYGYSAYSCPFFRCPISGRILGSEPERGDIVVFSHPGDNRDFIKRLIGLPGDKIQMKDGRLYINDELVPQTPDGEFIENYERQGSYQRLPKCANGEPNPGEDCVKEKYIETLPGGASHAVLNFQDGQVDNTPIMVVPQGQYFFMGDNRDNSTDSRVPRSRGGVGFVPYENLIGRADRVIFSSAGRSMLAFWTWRSDRFFKALD